MTASAPAREPGRAPVPIHPLAVRITHWLNAIAILIMIGSGWRIWNSSPIFDFHFPVGITLGGDVELSAIVTDLLCAFMSNPDLLKASSA